MGSEGENTWSGMIFDIPAMDTVLLNVSRLTRKVLDECVDGSFQRCGIQGRGANRQRRRGETRNVDMNEADRRAKGAAWHSILDVKSHK
jgi:hypothetical protein